MATSKDSKPPAEAPAPDDQAVPDELGPFHGYEPTWLREALTDILARLVKLEASSKK